MEPLYRGIREQCDFDLMFIDDDSPDGTAGVVADIAERDPGVRLLRRERKEGLGRAYQDAFRLIHRSGEFQRVFMMDADLSHQPVHLARMDRALDSYAFAVGSRYIRGVSVLNWSILRLNLSYMANKYIRVVTGMPFSDCTSGFRGFHSTLLPVLLSSRIKSSGYAFLVETLFDVWKSGTSVGEVPIVFVERRSGSSKVSGSVLLESLLTPLRLRFRSFL